MNLNNSSVNTKSSEALILQIRENGKLIKHAISQAFPALRVFVVGDVMFDRYLVGHCDRISPEAPVQVIQLDRKFDSPGGAANVASNLASLRISVELAGRIGCDESGEKFREACQLAGIGLSAITESPRVRTTVKTRVLAADRQLLRLDEEDVSPFTDAESDEALQKIFDLSLRQRPDAVILSDYAKGVCTPYFCSRFISFFTQLGVPIYIDPKGNDYSKYRGATAIKPNRSEILQYAVANGWPTDDPIEAAQQLRNELDLEFVTLTLGADGIVLVSADGVHRAPTVAREVYDVAGAGDTVIATMVAGLAAGLHRQDAVVLANLAAAEVIAHVGSRPIRLDELMLAVQAHSRGNQSRKFYGLEDLVTVVSAWKSQGLRVGFTNGCFDLLHAGHVRLLEDAAARVDKLIVAVNSDSSVQRLKGPKRPLMAEGQRITVLSALEAVDAVTVFEEDTPLKLLEAIVPNILIKGGDYTRETVVGADIVEANGGHIELIPLVPDISTSYLASAIEKL